MIVGEMLYKKATKMGGKCVQNALPQGGRAFCGGPLKKVSDEFEVAYCSR